MSSMMVDLLQALLSHDNTVRGQAEAAFNQVKESEPDQLLSELLLVMER